MFHEIRSRTAGRSSLWLAGLLCVAVLIGCQASDDPSVLDTEIVTWPGGDGLTAGQVIVTIRNDSDHAVNPDVFGRGRQTVAHLLDADGADEPTLVSVEDFELIESEAGLGAAGRLEWDGSGSAAARAIALDADGRTLGYLTTSEVRYDSGDFTMCCFPPAIEADDIDDVVVFGVQALADD